ncbi:DMT family transporter [Fluviibacterium sp. S390]|uniref:DMT family transporter n=1 Tax=Fluviibacterium sp. S390 TaxID=3415139 RepID=UPI003C7A7AC1
MELRYWLVIFALGIGWGGSFFFNEILLREIGPLSVSLVRVGFGALGCWIWIAARRIPAPFPKHLAGALLIFGAIQYALPLTFYPLAQQGITSSAAGIINAATPICAVIFGHFLPGGERATKVKSLAVGLGFAGIVVLMLPAARGDGVNALWGLLVALLAPVCYGIAVNYLRRFQGMDRVVLTAWSATIGAAMILPVSLTLEGLPVMHRPETWAAALIIGFVLTSAAFITMFWLIPIVGATAASTITFIAPISAVVLGVFVLKERLEPEHLLGMAIIFVALLILDGRLAKWLGRGKLAR